MSILYENKLGRGLLYLTVINEFSRFRHVKAFEEATIYTSSVFLDNMLKVFPFKVECVQTDNAFEFAKRFGDDKSRPSLFEVSLKQRGIQHKLIRPFTPRHNGKVERSHRKDNEYFYVTHKFYSFDDFKAQLAIHIRKYNNFPMRPLKWQSPKKGLHDFLTFGATYH